MKIKKVRIENFRGIDALELDLVNHGGQALDLVVFAGPNGCGKTAVMEACLLALGRADLVEKPNRKRNSRYDIRVGQESAEVQLELDDGTRLPWTLRLEKNGKGSTEPKPRLSSDEKERIQYFSSWRWPKMIGSVSVTLDKKGRKPDPANEENRLWILKQYFVNLRARRSFLDSKEATPFTNHEGEILARLTEAWRAFHPGSDDSWEPGVATEKVEEGFDLYLQKGGGLRIPTDSLSAGEIEILVMLGWFLSREIKPDILFIDEPELHLHPAWHRVLLRALRRVLPETQIVCSTHSTEILESVYSYERFTLLPENDPRAKEWNPRTEGDSE